VASSNDRAKSPPPQILASFETPEQDLAEIYEVDEQGTARAVRSAAADQASPAGRVSMGFSAEELKKTDGRQS
jgi:hypothetical protein